MVDRPFGAPLAPLVLGIDPGIKGGLALLYPDGRINAMDIPVVGDEVDIDQFARIVCAASPTMAVIERAMAMPSIPGADGKRRGMGAATSFKFGMTFGALKAAIACCGIPLHIVSAAKWKAHFRLDRDKEKSRALAIRFWPGCGMFARKRDEGRAEAALIARYGAETLAAGRVAA